MIIPDIYINAGGVTVSYFEWLKNLSHVRFGRMNKRFEEKNQEALVQLIEEMTGKKLSDKERGRVIHGGDEIDIVNSGLEQTMIEAYKEIRKFWKETKKCESLREAAFAVAINKIGNSYYSMGVFP
jgi:glutamate dehydrogenase (NAD(P)+)